MFHSGDDDFIVRLNEGSAVALGDEVDALCGTTNEKDLSGVRGVEKTSHLIAGALIGARGLFAQEMDAPMDVGVFRRVIPVNRIDDDLRLLACSRVVEVDKRLLVD